MTYIDQPSRNSRSASHRRTLPWGVATLGLLAAATGAAPAHAQAPTITISNSRVDRSTGLRDDSLSPLSISYEDCINDDVMTFYANLDGTLQDLTLEVWVGQGSTDCTEPDNRDLNSTITCWRVLSITANDEAIPVDVRVQDVAGRTAEGEGTQASCETPRDTAITFYFLLTESSDVVASDTFSTRLDTEGEEAPDNVRASPGDGRVIVRWDSANNDQITGYQVYCSDGSEPVDPVPLAPDAGPAPAATDPDCSAGVLVAGQHPPAGLDPCARAGRDQTRVYSDDRSNGTSLAVAVASVDNVGNVGPLSAVSCATPIAIDGFFDLYVDAGGQGGGGFCSVGRGVTPRSATAAASLVTSLLCLLALGGRRRRTPRHVL